MINLFSSWKQDLPAGLVVFLVALPLCLGIGLASTALEPRLFSGIIAGVVGGIIVSIFSGSRIGVSGPAAGLITIVAAAIGTLGGFEYFLTAVVISGVIQLISGILGAGVIGNYFPSSVIKGMLAAIGITLILKEIPHAFGYDADFIGDEAFFQMDGQNTFSEIVNALSKTSPGAILIFSLSLLILILFETKSFKKIALFQFLPSALFVVLTGIIVNSLYPYFMIDWVLDSKHLVNLPKAENMQDFIGFFTLPNFSVLSNPNVYVVGLTLALVASLETLLSVEATDKLDTEKRTTPTNRELKAQGIGNIISGLIGGLPITQVIVRSSANVNAGGKNKLSAIFHGILLLSTVAFIPSFLNKIPLASLAAILIMVGYKLAKIDLLRKMYGLGWDQFVPFLSTIIAVLFSDLLIGIGVGMVVSIYFILRRNYKNNYVLKTDENEICIQLSEEVTYLNKGSIKEELNNIKNNSKLYIDGSKCHEIDFDVLELIQEFIEYKAKVKNIEVKTINVPKIKS
ncbi:MAG: SulP family inorganic anion transporter [Flavobacteriia bacterium]|nr:SulP family inorganic anion transporter [Flavobacteriia bacterium]